MIHFEKKKYLNFFLIPNSKPNFCEQSTDHFNAITFEDNDLKEEEKTQKRLYCIFYNDLEK